jgi:hypothetical protein
VTAVSLSEPESDEEEEEEDEEDEDEDDEGKPQGWSSLTVDAIDAKSGLVSCKAANHFFDNLGRPLTVLCHTIGKLVMLAKFCVMATVTSRLTTTCHHPPGTNTVSPALCSISTYT